jgi:hypothetical protein
VDKEQKVDVFQHLMMTQTACASAARVARVEKERLMEENDKYKISEEQMTEIKIFSKTFHDKYIRLAELTLKASFNSTEWVSFKQCPTNTKKYLLHCIPCRKDYRGIRRSVDYQAQNYSAGVCPVMATDK